MVAPVPYVAERTRFLPEEVALVVEVVSAESEDRDRRYKPGLYADAGLPNLWRGEDERGVPVLHTYELDATTRPYVGTGVFRERLASAVPYPVEILPPDLAR